MVLKIQMENDIAAFLKRYLGMSKAKAIGPKRPKACENVLPKSVDNSHLPSGRQGTLIEN